MKTNAIIRIVIYSLVLCLLLGILAVGMGWHLFSYHSSSSTVISHSLEAGAESASMAVPLTGLDRIIINWAAGNIQLKASQDVEEIQITEFRPKESAPIMNITTNRNQLTIDFSDSDYAYNFRNSPVKNLTVVVPADWDIQKLELNTAACEITLDSLVVSEAEINTASGSCAFRDCAVGALEIDSASTDLTYTGTLEKFSLDSASGSAEITLLNNPSKIDMNAMSGDLTLHLPSDCGFQVESDTISGKVNCDFPFTMHDHAYIVGDGACKITVDGASCKLTIHDNHHASGEHYLTEEAHHEEAHH